MQDQGLQERRRRAHRARFRRPLLALRRRGNLPQLPGLGLWQLDRGAEKSALLADLRDRSARAPLPLVQLLRLDAAQQQWRQTSFAGEFDAHRYFLLDNAIRRGQVGYEVLHPLLLSSGELVLVNRGWVVGAAYRDQLPELPTVSGNLPLLAVATRPQQRDSWLATTDSWPRVIQGIDLEALQISLGEPLLPLVLRIDASSPGALNTDWPIRHIEPARHYAYALQWFAFALLLPVLFYRAQRRHLSSRTPGPGESGPGKSGPGESGLSESGQ